MKIGEVISSIIKKKGITQIELSKKIKYLKKTSHLFVRIERCM